jgi:DNA-binding LacI/PurR family transcriptional regulator
VSTAFLAGVASEAETAGYAMTIVSAPRGSVVSPVSQAAVDGLILYSVDDDSPALRVARTRQVPQVMVDQVPTPGVACVNVADRIGAGLAISHLFSLGHRRIGAVTVAAAPGECSIISRTATSTNYVARERYAGWCESAEKLGMRSLVAVSCPVNEREHGRHAAALLCQQPEPPTAIACLSNELALGLLAGLRAAGLRVPQEVSVIGFDDTPLAAMSRLPLSTIRQPYQEKGAVATRLLLDRIGPSGSNSTHRTPTHVLLPVQLITRASTGKAPPSG